MDVAYFQGFRSHGIAFADLLAQLLQFAEAYQSSMNAPFGLLNFESDELAPKWQKQVRILHFLVLSAIERAKQYAKQRKAALEGTRREPDDKKT